MALPAVRWAYRQAARHRSAVLLVSLLSLTLVSVVQRRLPLLLLQDTESSAYIGTSPASPYVTDTDATPRH